MESLVIPIHQRVRDKNAILLSDGFLPKSSITWSDFIPSWWSEERKRGLSRELSLVRGESSLSFSLVLVTWGHPFPLLLGWRYSPTSHTPKLVTGGRSGGDCLALVPFILNAVVTANIYLPIWVFSGWTPGYKKQIQLRVVCALHVCLNSYEALFP